jgi:hypothetical protein
MRPFLGMKGPNRAGSASVQSVERFHHPDSTALATLAEQQRTADGLGFYPQVTEMRATRRRLHRPFRVLTGQIALRKARQITLRFIVLAPPTKRPTVSGIDRI